MALAEFEGKIILFLKFFKEISLWKYQDPVCCDFQHSDCKFSIQC